MFIRSVILLAAAGVAMSAADPKPDQPGPIMETVRVTLPITNAALNTLANPKQIDVTTVGLSTVTVFANDLSPTEATVTVEPVASVPGSTTVIVNQSVTMTINTSDNSTVSIADPPGNGTFLSAGPSSVLSSATITESPSGNATASSPEATVSDQKNAAATAADR